MEFLITEQQLRLLLKEEERSQLKSDMKKLNSFTKQLVNRVLKSYGINLRMLMTWGTSVGGMVLPLDQFLRTQNLNLTEEQQALILTGIVFTLFFETKKPFEKVISKIKEEGLMNVFENGLRKGTELKESFSNFIMSLGVGTSNFLDTIAYSFLIPIITDIYSVATETQDIEQAAILIAERLIASGVILVSGQSLTMLIKRILERFS
jgi:hypothetical protein